MRVASSMVVIAFIDVSAVSIRVDVGESRFASTSERTGGVFTIGIRAALILFAFVDIRTAVSIARVSSLTSAAVRTRQVLASGIGIAWSGAIVCCAFVNVGANAFDFCVTFNAWTSKATVVVRTSGKDATTVIGRRTFVNVLAERVVHLFPARFAIQHALMRSGSIFAKETCLFSGTCRIARLANIARCPIVLYALVDIFARRAIAGISRIAFAGERPDVVCASSICVTVIFIKVAFVNVCAGSSISSVSGITGA